MLKTRLLPAGPLMGFVAAVFALVAVTLVSFRALEESRYTADRLTRSAEAITQLQEVLSVLKDAETGQRGFLLTGDESYLAPYNDARARVHAAVAEAGPLLGDSEVHLRGLATLQQITTDKLDELAESIALKRSGHADQALALVRTSRGKAAMDQLRETISLMQATERQALAERQLRWREAQQFASLATWVGAGLLLALIGAAAVSSSREFRARERESWVRDGLAGLGAELQGELRLEVLSEKVLAYLALLLNAQVGAIYAPEPDGRFRRLAGHALPLAEGHASAWRPGDGLVGQVALDRRLRHVREVPAGYLPVTSGTGQADPRELVVLAAEVDGDLQAVLELGFFRRLQPTELALLARASALLGMALRSSRDRTQLEQLLEETQRQAEELQAQQEELRVSNEELSEQGRVLQASQVQLELQQEELSQTNAELAEQSRAVAQQRDALEQAQAVLSEKATELARSNQYKSEFLANMSHELRTPLNSSLILAKLLADNKRGNLTEEQVRFAQTISAAGHDLLELINDILDLSKIEAGKVEVFNEPVALAPAVDSLLKMMMPQAREKGLALTAKIEADVPEWLETDGQRLRQILKNLMSNALKFTERGEVKVALRMQGEQLAFTVQDTGIGISQQQQRVIFDAFRQADGSTHRKYGGTGLGLSISRDLAHLLGGDIEVSSTPGQGSVFTLTLPLQAPARLATALPLPRLRQPGPATAPPAGEPLDFAKAKPDPQVSVQADEPSDMAVDHESGQARRILVIEDDERFAMILRDLAQEMGFACMVAQSASDGLALARKYKPSAILLDMNLPDRSGLSVLDQLKRSSQTRHVPVHVVSVADYSHEALALGAVGYALKPVKREQLVSALQQLEATFSQRVRQVLVVEDDARQRDSIRQLLAADEVQITDVASVGEALAQLQAARFDCMVMDLNLPDGSGFELLERMAATQSQQPSPPVIVYTGRSISRDEEQRLRKFSKSIIIKDARSPERLLDEVSLFLHQVESHLPPESQRMLQAARDRDATLEGRKILIVEDDARNIFALSGLLEPKGAKVVIARNGREALDALASADLPGAADGDGPVDLVLMDIMMPEMDGYEAMREIRKHPAWQKLPIIALTAKAMRDDQEKCLAAGANDYVAKPLDVDKLLSLIRVWMRG
ncbi:response regulator [Ideonella azotifigens]|uniref:histidine kinase n=1 Tax=Ideonella azotifigens TaxID=513160 RepID=A0ABN1JKH3_9BURK|nr:response regulator [Ideonella azotifigens]MCD2341835.1 response regulator [Ideonella azotifigens]